VGKSLVRHHASLHEGHCCGTSRSELTAEVLARHFEHSNVTDLMSSIPTIILRSIVMRTPRSDFNPKPASQAVQRLAREIVERSGANSVEHFNRVVFGEVSFRDQTKESALGR
jgi:hypothetical protein